LKTIHEKPITYKISDLEARLNERRDNYRERKIFDGATGAEIFFNGRRLINFSSNDYLGLANHPQVVEAFVAEARRSGIGAGAAHLITGHRAIHHQLEEELAAFTGRPRALLFSSGYLANLGIIAALCGRHDWIFSDRLNHASLIDGARYSGARLVRYSHNNVADLAVRIAQAPAGRELLIVTDGVFSMDGDIAPVPDLARVARSHGAWLMVDDAHGVGVMGRDGRGTPSHHGLSIADVPVLMGTLGKALGGAGAFVAGSAALIETLIQEARTYIYTTASPPALAAAIRVALQIAQSEPERRTHLFHLVDYFRARISALPFQLLPSPTPIQPLIIGSSARALEISRYLFQHDLQVAAIRPPTVPAGTARLRITLTSAHTISQIDRLIETLAAVSEIV